MFINIDGTVMYRRTRVSLFVLSKSPDWFVPSMSARHVVHTNYVNFHLISRTVLFYICTSRIALMKQHQLDEYPRIVVQDSER